MSTNHDELEQKSRIIKEAEENVRAMEEESERLRKELEALHKDSCPPPPPDNAMCYCRPPVEWDGNGSLSLSISIFSPAPIVILFGPRDCGKTMTLIRLTRYLMTQGYLVEPDRLFRSHYENICDNYMHLCYSNYAPGGNDKINFMLVKVRDRSGRPVCQFVKLPGDLCFDPHVSVNTPNSIFNTLLNIPNQRIWIFMTELDWGDCETRSSYVTYINKLLPYIQKDRIIFTCNKVDKHPELLLPDHRPNTKQLFRTIRNQYPRIFDKFKNKTPIIRLFKKWNVNFVPFSAGSFTVTENGKQVYIPSEDIYPRMLWKAILKAVLNNGKSEIGIWGMIVLAIIGFAIGLLITRIVL